MSSIYLHIPFCKQACHYCNFHFATSLKRKDELLEALFKELEMQQEYLQGEELQSIYFGGGTPSLLAPQTIQQLIDTIGKHYNLLPSAEITLEANPDDLTAEYLEALSKTAVNRLSIGIQSFADKDLQYMNRAHNATEALDCLKHALTFGFENYSIDLIYGTPTMTDDQWRANLQAVFELNVPHISCYALTVEPETALDHFIKNKKAVPVEDEHCARHFEILVEEMEHAGYEQYEISNFCKNTAYSKHNSAYWKGKTYLGIGPAAHSFNGESRQWNIANNARYIQSINQGEIPSETEHLSEADRYNEYIMTSLRTKWGVDLNRLIQFGYRIHDRFLDEAQIFFDRKQMTQDGNRITLTKEGMFLSDGIISDLFMD